MLWAVDLAQENLWLDNMLSYIYFSSWPDQISYYSTGSYGNGPVGDVAVYFEICNALIFEAVVFWQFYIKLFAAMQIILFTPQMLFSSRQNPT